MIVIGGYVLIQGGIESDSHYCLKLVLLSKVKYWWGFVGICGILCVAMWGAL